MRVLIFIFSLWCFLFGDIQTKSYIGFEYKPYLKKQKGEISSNSAMTFQSEIEYTGVDWKIYTLVDVLKDSEEEQRDYIHINELYFLKSFNAFDFYIGRKVIFLGSLEGHNLVDIFNRQNYQKDSLNEYKRGANYVAINYFFEDDSNLDFYIKFLEDDIRMPSKDSTYYLFSSSSYSEKVNFVNKNEEPSFLLNYSKSLDEELVADIAFGIFYGYDENILYERKGNEVNPLLFQSAKIFTHNTFLLEDTLFKVEASYTKVIEDGDFNIEDFYSLGMGLEYTIESLYKNHNLGLISEYYKSDNQFTLFDNDIFLALRYSLNDKDSSEFLLGFTQDLEKNEKGASLKYSGKLNDFLNISFDAIYINSESSTSPLNEHSRLMTEIKYYF